MNDPAVGPIRAEALELAKRCGFWGPMPNPSGSHIKPGMYIAAPSDIEQLVKLARQDLLAALQIAYETFKGQRLHHNRNVLGQMLSAIAKATGEQS